jgi:polyisoprenyl-teichoic acid--peptidoglycan teichoic acid transferase
MAREEKPYRVYKGGRVKGKVPAPPRPERTSRSGGRSEYKGPGGRRTKRPANRRRQVAIGVAVLLVLLIVWGVASFLSFRGGVADANERLNPAAKAALTDQSGLLLSTETNILLLGTDHALVGNRETDQHSDSIMLIHTDPHRHRIVFLSLPRDLLVQIPGYGDQKINAAYQIGGPALAIRTIEEFTGLRVNHIAIVDFGNFREMIDALGGIDVSNPHAIRSNRFDCPYKTQARCGQWQGWSFRKGTIHLDGHQALIYSRIRENQLDAGDTDITRGQRQQTVMQAVMSKLTSPGTLLKMPFVGGRLMKPIATDLSAGQFVQMGWLKVRGHTLHCRLGGDPESTGAGLVLSPNERNREVMAMVTGQSAPQPAPPGEQYAGGCS